MAKELERYRQIERSIITTYRKQLWSPFVLAVKKYRLIEAGDRIAVCISGGKDSMLMAKLMQELHRHSEIPFEPVFLVMDPGYNAENRRRIEENAALLQVPVTIFETDILLLRTPWPPRRPVICAHACAADTCMRRQKNWGATRSP